MKPPVIAGAYQWRGQGVSDGIPRHTIDCNYHQTKGARMCDCGIWAFAHLRAYQVKK